MPGQFDTDFTQDGVFAITDADGKNGAVGVHTAQGPATAGGGNGVLGVSSADNASGVFGVNQFGGDGVFGVAGSTDAKASCGGVFGYIPHEFIDPDGKRISVENGTGVVGVFDGHGSTGTGVFGASNRGGAGVFGYSPGSDPDSNNGGAGVFGYSKKGEGVLGITDSNARTGVLGINTSGDEASPGTSGGNGVFGLSNVPNASGVFGSNSSDGGTGVFGFSPGNGGSGVIGQSDGNGNGVFGRSKFGNAIHGVADTARAEDPDTHEITGALAGFFEGAVLIQGIDDNSPGSGSLSVTGDLSADGVVSAHIKNFVIDHPCDPANKFLRHSPVESPEMMNVYNGNVTTDANSEAWVVLPDYFDALNCDFRYQLTAIGQFSQAIIASEIAENRFCVRTEKPKVKVSWQVTGVRKDAFAKAHPIVVEQEKSEAEKGSYLLPRRRSQPPEKEIALRLAQPKLATPDRRQVS